MKVESIDHLVLTVKDPEATAQFYENVLGMSIREHASGRLALLFGNQMINLHQAESEVETRSQKPTLGSADICFITRLPIERVIEHLLLWGVHIIMGPVERAGATGQMTSVYFYDPDGNLVEIAHYYDLQYVERI